MKIWAYVILAGIIVAAASLAGKTLYNAGEDAADLKWEKAVNKLTEEIRAEERAAWKLSSEAAVDNIIIEEKIVERIKIVEREVEKVVVEYVTAECLDLGPDIQRLFNDAITAASNLPLPGIAAESPDSLP